VVNPNTFTVSDPVASAQSVTGVTILVGTVSGGPYPNVYPLTAAEISAGLASGTFTGTLASIGETLPSGTYFAVATATNAIGTSGNSPEVTFQVLTAPSAPVSLVLA
jgi:hypothetical protein